MPDASTYSQQDSRRGLTMKISRGLAISASQLRQSNRRLKLQRGNSTASVCQGRSTRGFPRQLSSVQKRGHLHQYQRDCLFDAQEVSGEEGTGQHK